jgi:DNA-binding transcriptional ArsR family regulator
MLRGMTPSVAAPRRTTKRPAGPARATKATAKATSQLGLAVPADGAGRDLLARFYRALGDPTRLGLLEFCAGGERTGSDCVTHSGLSQGRVSAHLACLVSCGLVSVRREGRFAFYQVTDPRIVTLVGVGAQIMADHAASIAACTKVTPSE